MLEAYYEKCIKVFAALPSAKCACKINKQSLFVCGGEERERDELGVCVCVHLQPDAVIYYVLRSDLVRTTLRRLLRDILLVVLYAASGGSSDSPS